ncbi:MAG: VWA domain-containing protein, partial [Actinomycetota bacterium]|nr:VWA domain-containing protein [Actinomycetota bacterium]
MSFAAPLVLIALVAIPLLARWYAGLERRRVEGARAFVTEPLTASVVPDRPRWRRHAPMLAFALALIALIAAAARPQRSVAVPATDGAVMLANDVSSSMASTDVPPSRLVAAARAAQKFTASVPGAVRVGLLQFNQRPAVLQTPSTDHSLTSQALTQLRAGGHTAIGDAIDTAVRVLSGLRAPGAKRLPGAIVLLSDGTSTGGADPLQAARQAARAHIPIYTVALGTAHGTITVRHGSRASSVPVPLDPSELQQIGRLSGGQAFT